MPAHPPVARHPIQIVARRTGLSADVIRAWEKRYDVVTPLRSDAGRRLYSDADVARLQLLARATLSGRTIGQVASLAPAALAALVRADDATTVPPDPPAARATAPHAGAAPERVDECLARLERFDVVALDAALRRAAVALSADAFIDALVVPFHDAVLERVRAGALRPAHEHLALSVLRRALDRVADAATTLAPPDLVVTTPLGQAEELGALIVGATAAAEGWRAVYVGSGLSAEAIADLTVGLGARAVVLGLGSAAGDRVLPRELRRLRALLPRAVDILAEGIAAHAHRSVLREIGAIVLRDAAALRARLRTAAWRTHQAKAVRHRA